MPDRRWTSRIAPPTDLVDWTDPINRRSPLARGLIAYWASPYSGNSLQWRDLTRRFPLTLITAGWAGSEYGQTLYAAGSGTYATLPTAFPRLSGSFTFATFINPTQVSTGYPYLTADWAGGALNYLCYLNAGNVTVQAGDGGGNTDINFTLGISANVWQLVVIRRSGVTVDIDVNRTNATQSGSYTGGVTANTRPIYWNGSAGNPFLGRSAWAGFWDRALLDSEVERMNVQSEQWQLVNLLPTRRMVVVPPLSFTWQARGQHAAINSFTAQARGRYTLGLLSFVAQQRGQSVVLNSLTAQARGAHGVLGGFTAVARGRHKVGIESFTADFRGRHNVINSFTAEGRGESAILTDFSAQARGRHTIFEPFTADFRGRHIVFEAFTAEARGQHSVLMAINTNFRGLHRLANDALARYELYRGTDALPDLPPDEPTATPWETFTGSTHTTAALTPPVSGVRTYYFVLRQRNAYNLASQNTAAWSVTIDDTGAIVATPPSAPIDVVLEAQASGTMRITARYLYSTDAAADRADKFVIWLTSNGSTPDPDVDVPLTTATYIAADGIGKLSHTTTAYANGTTIKAIVRMRRSGTPNVDSTNTAILTATAVDVGPDPVGGAGVFFGHVARQEQ